MEGLHGQHWVRLCTSISATLQSKVGHVAPLLGNWVTELSKQIRGDLQMIKLLVQFVSQRSHLLYISIVSFSLIIKMGGVTGAEAWLCLPQIGFTLMLYK